MKMVCFGAFLQDTTEVNFLSVRAHVTQVAKVRGFVLWSELQKGAEERVFVKTHPLELKHGKQDVFVCFGLV